MIVLHSVAVQNLIVLDRSYVSILFPDKEKWSGVRGFRRANVITFALLLDEFIEGIIFMLGHGVDLAVDRTWGVSEKVNGMIPFSRWRKPPRGLFTKYLLVAKVFQRYELFEFGFSFSSRLLG